MRKLASIQKIKSLEPIEGADAIEKAQVLGWQLVVKKGEYKIGDFCVYCEIDCIMPDKPEYAFLKPRKMRIRTVKLRGQVSQGICFPLSVLPKGVSISENLDVTDLLGIEKYEPPIPASLEGTMKGRFPSFIPKTDEPRVQIFQEFLDQHQGEKCYITEKLDGSSVTYYLNNGEFGVCSRNLELLEDDTNTLWKIAYELDIENKLCSLNKNYALQAEIVGEGIQKNTLNLRGQTVFFFNVFDINAYKYLDYKEFVSLMKSLKLKTVPIVEKEYILENDINKLVEMSIGKSLINPKGWREGIVIRSHKEQFINGERFSFKVVNPKFLLKYDG
ncbi:MAG: RNA ligase (ATP) [Bacteroidales bacterium]|nr:RNA ligase (ATP) [Bacteroidales bacterium]